MYMHDINPEKETSVLMIHPMLSDGMGLKTCIADHWGDSFRLLLPDLSGHADAVGIVYKSASDEASQIHEYLLENNCTHIQLGYCASLGGCVLLELLQYSDLTFEHLFFEGISMYENARILDFLSRKWFLAMHHKALRKPESAVRTMEKMYGEDAAEAMAKRFLAIDDESIENICHDCSFVHLPAMDTETQKKCVFAYGEKEFDYKNSRKILPLKYPEAELAVWADKGHCERISKDSEAYAGMLKQYLG